MSGCVRKSEHHVCSQKRRFHVTSVVKVPLLSEVLAKMRGFYRDDGSGLPMTWKSDLQRLMVFDELGRCWVENQPWSDEHLIIGGYRLTRVF